MSNYSPLRYPGGKGKLSPYVAEVLELNGLEGGHYAEPFAGGAAVALDLLFSERVKHIHINDLDPCVFAFWHSVVNDTKSFVAKVQETDVSVGTWMAARDIKRDPSKHSLLDVGHAAFFLNRTNRSGILNGGMIGGIAQDGVWKLDCRFNKEELCQRIQRIGFYQNRISVTQMNAALFLSDVIPTVARRSLVYIDPPYYVKGAYLYQNHFKHEDHVQLAEVISKLESHRWIVSYDNAEQIRQIYSKYDQEQFSISYSARNYGKGTEVMVFGPDVIRPARILSSRTEHRRAANAG